MQDHEIELMVGDAVYVGDCMLTVVDIDGSEVSFRIDRIGETDTAHALSDAVVRLPWRGK